MTEHKIRAGSRLQNNETGAIITVEKTEDRYVNVAGIGDPPAALKWAYYRTPTKDNHKNGRLVRISADRIFDGPVRNKRGYTVVAPGVDFDIDNVI
jgi:hypothetical protein